MNRLASLSFFVALGCAVFAGCESDPPDSAPGGIQPQFGPTTTQEVAPPPISGGTLLLAHDGSAVAADPDRDAIYIVDLATAEVSTIALQPGDEPGRLVEDASGRVHVALRSGGAVVTVDLASKSVVDRTSVCVAPRGVDYDPADDSVYVACASGELVQLPAAGGAPLRSLELDRDLRDVLVVGASIYVTRFRSAETLLVSKADWKKVAAYPAPTTFDGRAPAVAWRTIKRANDGLLMLHQRGPAGQTPSTEYYGPPPDDSSCASALVETAVWMGIPDGTNDVLPWPALADAVVPVDVAESPDGDYFAIASAGNAFTPGKQSVLVYQKEALNGTTCGQAIVTTQPPGQVTALAYADDSTLVVQTREPAALFFPKTGAHIRLSTVSRDDTGHDVFHANSGADIACASCHPEGGDDGRIWAFSDVGERRTPSLRGTVASTAPYHWAGDMRDFPQLAHEVFSQRMKGPALMPDQMGSLANWVDRIPAPAAPPASDADAVARGKALFEGAAGCSTCHEGDHLTNNTTVDVGTGATFQVPPLTGIAYRAPFMHDGCAATLKDRFGQACGGGDRHGSTSGLTDANLDDLVAYLETL